MSRGFRIQNCFGYAFIPFRDFLWSRSSLRSGTEFSWLAPSLMVPLLIAWVGIAQGKVFQDMEEALQEVFPGAEAEKETVFLSESQVATYQSLSDQPLPKKVIVPYKMVKDGKTIGTVYFDRHRVRTLPEILMVALDLEANLVAVRVLAFKEPLEYLPKRKWYDQFNGKSHRSDLRIHRDIQGVSGATLTTHATSRTVRRILILHKIIHEQVEK